MQAGSLVEVVCDFDKARKSWPEITYPDKGDILTVASIRLATWVKTVSGKDIHMLTFEELQSTPELADQTVEDKPNFVEVQPPMDVEEEVALPQIEYLT